MVVRAGWLPYNCEQLSQDQDRLSAHAPRGWRVFYHVQWRFTAFVAAWSTGRVPVVVLWSWLVEGWGGVGWGWGIRECGACGVCVCVKRELCVYVG